MILVILRILKNIISLARENQIISTITIDTIYKDWFSIMFLITFGFKPQVSTYHQT